MASWLTVGLLAALAQPPTVTNINVGGGNYPAVSTNLSPIFNAELFYFDQNVTNNTTVLGGLYYGDGTLFDTYAIINTSTNTYESKKKLQFDDPFIGALEQTNFYIMAVAGMAANANGAWDGTFSLPGGLTNRLNISVNAVYWTNTATLAGDFNEGNSYNAHSAGTTESGLGFMRSGAYGITNFSSGGTTRRVFLMDATNGTVTLSIGIGNRLYFNQRASGLEACNSIAYSAGMTSTLEVVSGTLESSYGLVVGYEGVGRLVFSGNATTGRIASLGDVACLGYNAGSRGELMVSNGAALVVSNSGGITVGNLGAGYLTADAATVQVGRLLVANSIGSDNSRIAVTRGGVLAIIGTDSNDSTLGFRGTNAMLTVSGAGSRLAVADSAANSNRYLRVGNGSGQGSVEIRAGATAYLGYGNGPLGGIQIGVNAANKNNGLSVDGAGSSVTARTLRVCCAAGPLHGGGMAATQSLVIAGGATTKVQEDLVVVGAAALTTADRTAFNGLVRVDNGGLAVVSNVYFGADLFAGAYPAQQMRNGQMIVQNSGTVAVGGKVVVGDGASSTNNGISITGALSRLEVAGPVVVGQRGASNLVRVLDGGMLTAGGGLVIGQQDASRANTVTVKSATTSLAYIQVTNAAHAAQVLVHNGGLNIASGGVLRADFVTATNSGGVFNLLAGGKLILNSTNASKFGASGLLVPAGAVVAGIGALESVVTNFGYILPNGVDVGVLTFNDGLVFEPSSRLLINVSGQAAGGGGGALYDQIRGANRAFALNGKLDVLIGAGMTAAQLSNSWFIVMTNAAGFSGRFTNVVSAPPGRVWVNNAAGYYGYYTNDGGSTIVLSNYVGSSPTAVVLYDFRVCLEDGWVKVTWATASEDCTQGFDLLRLGENGEWVRVNAGMIPAQGVDGGGATYGIPDPGAQPGQRCAYRLLEYSCRGLEEYGPFEQEAVAFEVAPPWMPTPGCLAIRWLSRTNETYTVSRATNLNGGFTPQASGLPATPPQNVYTADTRGISAAFYRVVIQGK